MPESVVRECLEEIGAEVSVGPLLHVAEVFKSKEEGLRHQVEALFLCEIAESYEPRLGPKPDRSQVDTIWADPIAEAALFRPPIAAHLTDPKAPFYLGQFPWLSRRARFARTFISSAPRSKGKLSGLEAYFKQPDPLAAQKVMLRAGYADQSARAGPQRVAARGSRRRRPARRNGSCCATWTWWRATWNW